MPVKLLAFYLCQRTGRIPKYCRPHTPTDQRRYFVIDLAQHPAGPRAMTHSGCESRLDLTFTAATDSRGPSRLPVLLSPVNPLTRRIYRSSLKPIAARQSLRSLWRSVSRKTAPCGPIQRSHRIHPTHPTQVPILHCWKDCIFHQFQRKKAKINISNRRKNPPRGLVRVRSIYGFSVSFRQCQRQKWVGCV